MQGKNLDIFSLPNSENTFEEEQTANKGSQFIGVQFACCGVYSRVYRNKQGTHYLGNCPKCAKQVRFKIGPGGSDSRFFTAY